jgi:LCP family protein required for cell wall assembly
VGEYRRMYGRFVNKHLNDRQLLSYLEGDLSPGRREQVDAHLSACPACRARLERLAQMAADLTETLDTVGTQIPLTPDRSWMVVAQRWTGRCPRRLLVPVRPLLRYAMILAILALVGGGLAGLIHTWAVTGPTSIEPTPTATPVSTASPSLVPGPLPLSRPDRLAAPVSFLVLGVDGENTASDEIDALMLFHVDAEGRRAFLLSIPRDLYVEVPGHGQTTIGSVYGLGARDEAMDGLALVRETVSATLGLSVEHTVLVRFESFVTLIDMIGGVDVDVLHPIDDADFPDGRGGSDPLSIPGGRQHLSGALALRYARTRAIPAPGFDRTFRQQQLALAVHDRVTRLDLLPDLIAQAPALWSAVADLSLSKVIDLALLATDLTVDDITTIDLEECCTVERTASSGAGVLLPRSDEIKALMESLAKGEE